MDDPDLAKARELGKLFGKVADNNECHIVVGAAMFLSAHVAAQVTPTQQKELAELMRNVAQTIEAMAKDQEAMPMN